MIELLEPDVSTEDADVPLQSCTDVQWLVAHRALAAMGIPTEELTYTWAPGVPFDTVRDSRLVVTPPPPSLLPRGDRDLARAVSSINAQQMSEIITRTRKRGVVVREMPGWERRGRSGLFTPRGDLVVIDHHDASTRKSGEWGSLGYILSGSSISPLSQWQVARCLDGVPKLAAIAAGRCNHGGAGGPMLGVPRDSINRYAFGIEKANDGRGEPYTDAAREANDALQLSILEVV